MSYCTHCGHPLGVSRFCTNCGAPVATPDAGATAGGGTARTDTALTDTAERQRPVVPLPSGPHPPSARYPLYADTPPLGPPPSAPPASAPPVTSAAGNAGVPTEPDATGEGPRRRLLWPVLIGTLALLVVLACALAVVWVVDDGPVAGDRGVDRSAGEDGSAGPVDAGNRPTEDLTGQVASVEVPGTAPDSVDARTGETVTFGSDNLTDGDSTTAWRVAGDATGSELVIDFGAPVELRELGLVNGYAKSYPGYDGYRLNRRILAVTWTFDDGTVVEQDLAEEESMQVIPIESVTTEQVRLTLVEVSDPGAGPTGKDYTAISDLRFGGVTG